MALTPEAPPVADDGKTVELEFHYVKSPTYHSFHVDGVVASPNASGMAVLTLYSERLAIPRRVSMDLDPNTGKKLSDGEKFIEGKSGVVRTMEATFYASISAAKEMRSWLDEVIEHLEEMQNSEGDDDDE